MKKVYLIGNPNVGKSTIFNAITHSNRKISNWNGVSVDIENREIKYHNQSYLIYDLPGIYSLQGFTLEEKIAVQEIAKNQDAIFVNIINFSNLKRSLNLTIQLLEVGLKVVIIFNFFDNYFDVFDMQNFDKNLGIKSLNFNPKNREFLPQFFDLIKDVKTIKIPYLEKFKIVDPDINSISNFINSSKNSLDCITQERQLFIQKILKNTQKTSKKHKKLTKIDRVLLNKHFIIFAFLLFGIFVFWLAFGFLGERCSSCFGYVCNLFTEYILSTLKVLGAPQMVESFCGEVLAGVGGVLCFLPQIAILYLFMQILEQSGVLSRFAWGVNPILKRFGLSGQGVFSLLMGFGCTTTALPTTITIKDKRERIKTAMLLPYMSCSAKLPVFACICGAFLGSFAVLAVFLLYLLGVLVGVCFAGIMQKIYPTKNSFGVMEFTPVIRPKLKVVLSQTLTLMWQFIKKITTIILFLTIILWFFNNFSLDFRFLEDKNGESILLVLGKLLTPIFAPLGFEWGNVVTLLVGLSAKEMIISSIAVLNGVSESGVAMSIMTASSPVHFTSPSCVSFLVFCLLYSPCISALAQLKSLLNKKVFWRYVFVQFIIAYMVSLVFYDAFLIIFNGFSIFNMWFLILSVLAGICLYFVMKRYLLPKKKCFECNLCNRA